ncbi:MAG: B12-binding domain-containing radical SAM protein [candidate division KSB1 bacterium]|nr:B12-binding domain-containing radical SAM protein [candidate division KSB1 bacterium]MDZ7385364.1 B12-binding domain-containing radical SAM protein [candidate division KSB1 bacterium]MDZ7393504.1 B12-binding domain-containing radical SAM protein [candidate division KSB1 bacterium]MDZ7413042.1 B12-binding domain-containing radical SAM protein [candidate division KSB1 bacterium]
MAKLVLIEPKAPNLHIFTRFPLPRLGTIILATIARQKGWDAHVFVEEQGAIDWQEVAQADLVGVSTVTSTAPRAYAIADRVRSKGIPVVLGGPHVTYMPEEAITHADYVLRGEAESSFPLFLEALTGQRPLEEVPNLVYRKDGTWQRTTVAAPPVVLDEIPFPDFSLVRGKQRTIGRKRIIPVQTSRGCPYNCSFCSVTGMFGRKYRFRSTENVIAELRRYDAPNNFVFFYDDNFAANPKRTRRLLEAMCAEGFRFKWSTQVRADLTKDEDLVRLMRRAGCHTVFVGFETVNPASLQATGKHQTVKEMEHATRIFRRHRINVHGMFILGLDDDTFASVKATVAFAKKHRLASAQFLILTPLPGSQCFEQLRAEGRIAFTDWSLYDAHHVVFEPRGFSLWELQMAQIWAHQRFYSITTLVRRLLSLRLEEVAIAHYARRLNAVWRKKNSLYLRLLSLLKAKTGGRIKAEFWQDVAVDLPS